MYYLLSICILLTCCPTCFFDVVFNTSKPEYKSAVVFNTSKPEYKSAVVFNTSKPEYKVGDNVILTCYVKSENWLKVSLQRNDITMYHCYCDSRCIPTHNETGSYIAAVHNTYPTLIIMNVTIKDSNVNFTCRWSKVEDTISFIVRADTSPIDHEEETVNVPGWVIVLITAVTLLLIVCAAGGLIKWCNRRSSREKRHAPPSNTSGSESMSRITTNDQMWEYPSNTSVSVNVAVSPTPAVQPQQEHESPSIECRSPLLIVRSGLPEVSDERPEDENSEDKLYEPLSYILAKNIYSAQTYSRIEPE